MLAVKRALIGSLLHLLELNLVKRIRLLRRFWSLNGVLLSFAFLVVSPAVARAQSSADPNQPVQAIPEPAITAEALQTRIERARALIAAHRLDTAASELESARAATRDYAFRNITSVMLMSVYLEEGNYGRAEALLEETFQARSVQKDESLGTYFALAGQAVNGARTHLARYRAFGINTNDANLPEEASSDLNRLRSLLERMIAQAKEIASGRRTYDSLSLLEDVLGIRSSLAKDSEDKARWEAEYASAREGLASSQTQIASLGGVAPLRSAKPAANKVTAPSPYSTRKVSDAPLDLKGSEKKGESSEHSQSSTEATTGSGTTSKPDAKETATKPPTSEPATTGPELNDAGSLNAFATRKVVPRYPPMAKQVGAAGLVRVHVIVEGGKVVAVSRSEGPVLLRSAAEDAARQWSFQVVSIEGRPTRLSGYIDFTFTL
jgi:hypothetical protein